ncbi:glycosyltransferase involved in cell wall biosynthesis [Halorubrum alkaliphilum]|uniref:Glycosyltransferase involved in cell wall biosynthesis n=1 Tax=Halorubrum alkaliphilum TaxID=261290 RepID=A0A8T4GIE9_9EURY|nr:glycosyltransferase family 4 protein [Halorubrum alkaliphilum]MBP1924076.1 glycosyltransferase involved in cell wall biosynthesis [Halorubrum alkaliphilum]
MTDISVLFLTKYDRKGASSRYRAFKYFPYLEKEGIQCSYESLFTNKYLTDLFENGNRKISHIVKCYVRRIYDLFSAHSYDLVFLQKELFPYLPAVVERLFSSVNIRYILDIDDAIFHNYDLSDNYLVEYILGKKIDVVMRNSEMVIAGNEYLASRARQAGAPSTEIIPTVIDLDQYPTEPSEQNGNPFVIGWIGSPSTSHYVEELSDVLRRIADQRQIEVRLIGSGDVSLPGVPYEVREWSEETEVDDLRDIDVGIMPLHDTPWTRGKCGFKLIQYMGMWKPVVASPVGVNRDLVDNGVNGYLADSQAQWINSLLDLCDNPDKRNAMGVNGHNIVEDNYCYSVTGPKIVDIIKNSTV